MEHFVKFNSGYDCIRFECRHGSKTCKPGSGGSHGRHGLTITFISKGDQGAVQFVLYTNWEPQYVNESSIGCREIREWQSNGDVLPADLGYHSKVPQYDGQESRGDCQWLDGAQCFYDGSGLNANDAMYALVNGGDKALWEFLDGYYCHVFSGSYYPVPAEYPTKLR